MGLLDDIFGSGRKKKRSRRVVKAWALWARGYTKHEGPVLVEVFKTKAAARARIKALLRGANWRKASDYEIRQTKIPSGRIFEHR